MLETLILAIFQGLTEFLPVSSSGHLVLLQYLFGHAEGDLFLDVVLHGGTLGSVVVVYRREIFRLLRFDRPALMYLLALFVGTLPAVVVGLLFKDQVEEAFAAPLVAAVGFFLTGLLLLSTRKVSSTDDLPEPWEPRPIALKRAILVGCAQAMAICPGISRSGSTIAASLWLGLPRAEAARFSFLLSVPAIGGALVLMLLDGDIPTRVSSLGLALSALAAFAVGLVAIKLTALAVVRSHFWKFAFYVLPLSAVTLFQVLR